MKTNHVTVTITEEKRVFTRIHLKDPMLDITLCGIALEGDTTNGLSVAVDSYKPISCERCIKIIEACKAVKAIDIKRPS